MLANSTAMRTPLQTKLVRYRKMFSRKAFLHYYVDLGASPWCAIRLRSWRGRAGLAVERMAEAETALLDVVAQYQTIHDSSGAGPPRDHDDF